MRSPGGLICPLKQSTKAWSGQLRRSCRVGNSIRLRGGSSTRAVIPPTEPAALTTREPGVRRKCCGTAKRILRSWTRYNGLSPARFWHSSRSARVGGIIPNSQKDSGTPLSASLWRLISHCIHRLSGDHGRCRAGHGPRSNAMIKGGASVRLNRISLSVGLSRSWTHQSQFGRRSASRSRHVC